MNIRESLLAGQSKASTDNIVKYIGDDKARFKELVAIFLEGDYRLTQRAAWPLSYAVIAHPQLVKPYLSKFIQMLKENGHHPAIARNILRLMEDIELPEKHCGEVLDLCMGFITNQTQPIAVRAFAITVSADICNRYPELKPELVMILNDLKQFPQTPAITSRIKQALKIMKTA